MKCPKCQADNPEPRKFCYECGTKLSHVCPECGAENLLRDKFCGECGHALAEPRPIDYSQPQSYTPKFLADKILTSHSAIEGERKLVTVLFADVANYTSMSEKLDPEEVHQIMDGCFKLLMDEIHRYEGTIDKFTGDGVMALFGAPVAHEDHAQRACYAALAMQRAIDEYGQKVKNEHGVEFKMRVGLNSGPVVVGSIGNDLRMDYTAVGDTVNLASRMESMAQPSSILVSADTHRLTRDFFLFEPLGKVSVKGKEWPVEAYELVKVSDVQTRFGAAVARGLTRFVGRQKEITALKEAFDKAQSGSGQVIDVVGEAGVGKSRLLLELREKLREEEYSYLEGRCLHYGGSMPYLPILDILTAYFDIKDVEQEPAIKRRVREKMQQLDLSTDIIIQPLYDILSLSVEDEDYLKLKPPQKRERIFEAIRDLLIRESQDRPLVLVVEDLHWIDKTSEEYLNYLIEFVASTCILLILLHRPEYTDLWGSKSYYNRIGVDQLSAKTSAELVQSILEEGEIQPQLRELILGRAGGNPLFVEELTHTLLENGSIQKTDHQYVLTKKPFDIQVPDTIQGIIGARIDRLEEGLKRTMQVASVIGRDFAFRILHTITGMQEKLKSHLLDLQAQELIYEKSLFPELEYIFKHALTQEVAYNSLLLKRRKKIHERIGKAIEELYLDRMEEFYEVLAHHYSKSEDWEKAYQYLKLSGDKATRSYSNWEAFRLYKEAIDVLNRQADSEENKRKGVEIRLLMATTTRNLGYPEDSLRILHEGERLSRELADEKALAYFYSSLGLYYTIQADSLRGIRYNENAFEAAEKAGDIGLMAPISSDLCTSYVIACEMLKVVEVAPKVISLLEKSNRRSESFGQGLNVYSSLLASCGNAMGCLGNFAEGEALFEKALRFALGINDLNCVVLAEVQHSYLFVHKGDGGEVIAHSQKAIEYSQKAEFFVVSGVSRAALGWGYYLLGELETAREHVNKALKIQEEVGTPFLQSVPHLVLGMVNLDSNDLENAGASIEQALKLSQNNNRMYEGMSRISLGRVLGKADRSQSDKAEKHILQGIKVLHELRIRPWLFVANLYLGDLYADRGQREKAFKTVKKAEAAFKEMGMHYWLRRTQGVLARLES